MKEWTVCIGDPTARSAQSDLDLHCPKKPLMPFTVRVNIFKTLIYDPANDSFETCETDDELLQIDFFLLFQRCFLSLKSIFVNTLSNSALVCNTLDKNCSN